MTTKVAYEATPRDTGDIEPVRLDEYPMRLVKVAVDKTKQGFQKFQFNLPNDVRLSYHNHPIFGADWARQIRNFDSKLLFSSVLRGVHVKATRGGHDLTVKSRSTRSTL